MDALGPTAFLFVMAVLFAVFEIEAEGKYGWAEKFPTWYRVNGPAKWYVRVTHKPLTGYHLPLFLVSVMLFLWPMAAISNWSWAGVLAGFANYFAWVVVWDYCWFILNPHYGWSNFRRSKVWWFGNEPWLGSIPVSYLASWVTALAFAAASGAVEGNLMAAIADKLAQLFLYGFGLFQLVVIVAPFYHRYYEVMRRHDERDQAGIFH